MRVDFSNGILRAGSHILGPFAWAAIESTTAWVVQTTETGSSFLEARKSLKLRRTSFHGAATFSGEIGTKILLPTPSWDVNCHPTEV